MAKNPLQFVQLAERLKIFRDQHPRVLEFIQAVGRNNLQPGVILELRVTDLDGKVSVTNMRLTEEDIETIGIIKDLKG
ncbi:MAG: hypothetical protein IJ198_08450 [Lachnospiraceae bacterium]|nr:hypothetical protein [Lachnospiraceae bacterium]MBQ9060583.1 hypothetical protein [Bacillota bacterium]